VKFNITEKTPEQKIADTLKAARDSVWVVTSSIEKLTNGEQASEEIKDTIERNVEHLKLVVANPLIADSGQDISDLQSAITNGTAKVTELTAALAG
jgi:predicted GTPase